MLEDEAEQCGWKVTLVENAKGEAGQSVWKVTLVENARK